MTITKRDRAGRISQINVLERLSEFMGDTDEECWELTHKDRGPGGHLRIRRDDKKRMQVHRLAWEAFNAKPIPVGFFVLHTCDNPCCFNPNHLYAGTLKQNAQDRRNRKGLDSYARKIPLDEVPKILVSTSPANTLAEKYGVTRTRILQLWRGEHIPSKS